LRKRKKEKGEREKRRHESEREVRKEESRRDIGRIGEVMLFQLGMSWNNGSAVEKTSKTHTQKYMRRHQRSKEKSTQEKRKQKKFLRPELE
jgi:hypothetical protein